MEKQRDNHIEQNVMEQNTTEQGGIYRKIRILRWMKQVWGDRTCAHPGGNIYPIDYSIHYVDIVEKWKIYYCIDRSVYDVQWRL